MFKELKKKIILSILSITACIVFVSFSFIYIGFNSRSFDRQPIPDDAPAYTSDVSNIITNRVRQDRETSSSSLLSFLVVSGILIELIVAAIAYFLVDHLLRPTKKAYESQKSFIANSSHEIKTPLAAIQANLEAIEEEEPKITKNHWFGNINKEVNKLSELNSQLLNLSRIDLNDKPIKLEEVNLSKIVQESINRFEPRLKKINLKFINHIRPEERVKTNPGDYLQILNILLDNATKYCNKEIEVSLSKNRLVITNDGQIIKKDELEKVFERFYQNDKNSEGVGLGLAIAKSIAENNGWKLYATNDNNKTNFVLLDK